MGRQLWHFLKFILPKSIMLKFKGNQNFDSLKNIEEDLQRSQVHTVLVGSLLLASQTFLFFQIVPVWREYSWHMFIALIFFWMPFVTTAICVFLFSPLSDVAAERFICRKLFLTLMFLVLVPSVSVIYVLAGERATELNGRNSNSVVNYALQSSGYIERLPPNRKIPMDDGADDSNSGKVPSLTTPEPRARSSYAVAMTSDVIWFLTFVMSSERILGAFIVIILTLGVWLDTMLATWRVKRRLYGLNAFEAAELSQFVWDFERHDGGGGGRWINGPMWVRGHNQPTSIIVEPETKNG